MIFVLEDNYQDRVKFLPLTFTKPISEIMIGILTIKEKWELFLKENIYYKTENYLSEKYIDNLSKEDKIYINSTIFPNQYLVEEIKKLKSGDYIEKNGKIIAYYYSYESKIKTNKIELEIELLEINNIWDIFINNAKAIEEDFKLITKNKKSESISDTNKILGKKENIFLEKGVEIECSILSVGEGYMYFGENSTVMEGTMIKGNFCARENSVIKMGAKIYGATSIGKYSKIGGEISNTVIGSYSNKAHDGFLGNSVIGEWCNLGADTNSSNLKNNYSKVSIWDYLKKDFVETTQQFLGLIMGDHSKSGINTMFNTGTIVGCFCNIFGEGFPNKYIPNFSWGNKNLEDYDLKKAIETTEIVMGRRGLKLKNYDKEIYSFLYNNRY